MSPSVCSVLVSLFFSTFRCVYVKAHAVSRSTFHFFPHTLKFTYTSILSSLSRFLSKRCVLAPWICAPLFLSSRSSFFLDSALIRDGVSCACSSYNSSAMAPRKECLLSDTHCVFHVSIPLSCPSKSYTWPSELMTFNLVLGVWPVSRGRPPPPECNPGTSLSLSKPEPISLLVRLFLCFLLSVGAAAICSVALARNLAVFPDSSHCFPSPAWINQ